MPVVSIYLNEKIVWSIKKYMNKHKLKTYSFARAIVHLLSQKLKEEGLLNE